MKSFSGWMTVQGLYALEKVTNEIYDSENRDDAHEELARQLDSAIDKIDKQAAELARKFQALLEKAEEASA